SPCRQARASSARRPRPCTRRGKRAHRPTARRGRSPRPPRPGPRSAPPSPRSVAGPRSAPPDEHRGRALPDVVPARTRRARELFAPLGPTYDRYARLLSLGQDPRWRRFLVSRVETGAGDRVLDVATGTGLVAAELIRQKGSTVVGLDQSPEMLA